MKGRFAMVGAAGLALVLVAGARAGQGEESVEKPDFCRLSLQGRQLSSTVVAPLEEALLKDPDDLVSRILLTGYYSRNIGEKGAAARLREHTVWVIRNRPESDAAYELPQPVGRIEKEATDYVDIKKEWLAQMEKNPENADILMNAAQYVRYVDQEEAIDILKRAAKAAPDNPWPHLRLASVYESINTTNSILWDLDAKGVPPPSGFAFVARLELEAALELIKDEQWRFQVLSDTARAAFDSADIDVARRYAQEIIDTESKMRDSWYHPIALHEAHTVLGGIAVREGDLKKARKHLYASTRVKHTCQSSWYSPTMALANDMLRKGQAKAVLKYLKLLRKWDLSEYEAGQLKDFEDSIRNPEPPRLGTSYGYY